MYQSFRLRSVGLVLLACATALFVFAAPALCAQSLQEGLALCSGPLLVSLYPFLIISTLLMRCGAGRWFGVLLYPVVRLIGLRSPSAGGVLLMGAVGGFAPAAASTAEAVRSGQLSASDASALLPACICSGPSFVVLTAGEQFLGSRVLGIRLFAAQLLAGWLTAALLNRLRGNITSAAQAARQMPAAPHLDQVIGDASVTYLRLCGFILYFRLLAAGSVLFLPQQASIITAMLLEVCSGCDLASRSGLWASSLCCAALSLQGLSVLLQVRTLCPAEVSFRPLLLGRLVHLPLSMALFYLFLPGGAAETFSTLCERVIVIRRVPPDCAFLVFLVCCFAACQLCRCAEKHRRTARLAKSENL